MLSVSPGFSQADFIIVKNPEKLIQKRRKNMQVNFLNTAIEKIFSTNPPDFKPVRKANEL